MTNEQARKMFNKAIAVTTNPDAIAKIELCREYFTNPEFKKNLEQFTWDNRK